MSKLNLQGVQQFELPHEYYDDAYCVVEIDFNYPGIINRLRESYVFYFALSADATDQKIVKSFLQMVAVTAWRIYISATLNACGVRRELEGIEGYPKFDGSEGIRFLLAEGIEVDRGDFRIIQVAPGTHNYFQPKD